MLRAIGLVGLASLLITSAVSATDIQGRYLETRTCQVYTGPCFANSEMGLAGKNAVMAWNIESGAHDGVDLSGLSVVVALSSDNTLGFYGIDDANQLKSVVYVDRQASPEQREALLSFAREHTGRAGDAIARVTPSDISMGLDTLSLRGHLYIDDVVNIVTRKARPEDCICKNETAFYPPLAQVNQSAAGVTEVSEFRGRGLGVRWSAPGARSAYMATFAY